MDSVHISDGPHVDDPLPVVSSRPPGEEDDDSDARSDDVTRWQAYCLYLSHFLSMWNSRMYEFGAILFIQKAFPGNLIASSINGIVETLCVLLFSSALGRWVDHAPSRLRTLLITIITNRITVVVSCMLWFLILSSQNQTGKQVLFAIVLTLGMVEKLSRMTNILSMERDWVPTLAPPSQETGSYNRYGLTHLNAVMRRIDLLCKLVAPLAISTFISAIAPIKVAIIVVAVASMLSWGIECWSVQKVWKQNRRLRVPKTVDGRDPDLSELDDRSYLTSHKDADDPSAHSQIHAIYPFVVKLLSDARISFYEHVDGLRYYFSTPVWIPSVCLAILHASVLGHSSTFIVYLLNGGFTLGLITVARAIGSLFEISSTFIYPWAVYTLSRSGTQAGLIDISQHPKLGVRERLIDNGNSSQSEVGGAENEKSQVTRGVVRVGLFGVCGLFLNLIPVALVLFYLDSILQNPNSPTKPPSPFDSYPLATITLFGFLSFSLLGRWMYDLSTTQLSQTLIPASHRSSFGGTEMSIVSCVSLVHWVTAACWHEQSDFKWLALGSLVAVGMATAGYGLWVKRWEAVAGGQKYRVVMDQTDD